MNERRLYSMGGLGLVVRGTADDQVSAGWAHLLAHPKNSGDLDLVAHSVFGIGVFARTGVVACVVHSIEKSSVCTTVLCIM
jgi:hypothetical protein